MSTALETVRQYYDAFNRRDRSTMLSLLHDEIRHEPNQGTPRLGKALFAAFMQHMDDCYAETLHDIVLFEAAGTGRVAAEFTVHGTYLKGEEGLPPAHGQTYQLPAAAFLEVEDGLIRRVTTYYNLPLWIELVQA